MARLSRAETQERNRGTVLAAARAEFAERGYRDAKVDVIAERAELTRGAVYSNFPSKRALYLAVLADDAEHAGQPSDPHLGRTPEEALGAFARAWLSRPRLLIADILADERVRRPFTQLLRLDALLLALSLETLRPPNRAAGAPPARLVRLAETVLTTLHGASQLSDNAPGFVEPFDVISACERLAGLALNDFWAPPHATPSIQPADAPWSPPDTVHAVTGEPTTLTGDGVVAVLGLHRVAAVEEAIRAGTDLTAVLVTSDPRELMPLARLMIAELSGCLRQSFPRSVWPRLNLVYDDTGAIAAAAGVPAVSDETETAIRVTAGRIVARAEGPGACHATASHDRARSTQPAFPPR
jgi:AcrR family transcriptional regulator